MIKFKIFRDWKIINNAILLNPRFENTCFVKYYYPSQCYANQNFKIKISISIIRINNNLNEDFNIVLNKSSNQIEGKDDDF